MDSPYSNDNTSLMKPARGAGGTPVAGTPVGTDVGAQDDDARHGVSTVR